MRKYIPGHVIDEAKDRRRQGDSVESLAARIGVPPEELAMLLREPVKRETVAADEFDLFRVDELEAQL